VGGSLIESILTWLSGLPPVAVYAVLGLLALVENIIPPVPADAAVLLGAFLSHSGVTSPGLVFAVVWVCNVTGALGVYVVARRYGQRLFASSRGRKLVTPEAIAVVEREYLRFGLLGIFFARFLPGIRAVVPPFAGIVQLSPWRIALPIVAHSALWYGGVTLAGTLLGAEWSRLSGLLAQVNRALGIAAGAVVVVWAVLAYLRARRRRRERVWLAATRAMGDPNRPEQPVDPRAAAMLVLELAYADSALTAEDRAQIEQHLRARWGLVSTERPSTPAPEPERRARLASYRERLVERFAEERRIALVESMWQAVFADRTVEAPQDRFVRHASELLGLTPAEVAEAARRAREAGPIGDGAAAKARS
jgi:membrane protein DedA with SNARE-associated domain/uncharacterized tellurite resistance protein B-like protein